MITEKPILTDRKRGKHM